MMISALLIAGATLLYSGNELCAVDDGLNWKREAVYVPYRYCRTEVANVRQDESGRACVKLDGRWPECCYTPNVPAYEGLGGRWACERTQCHATQHATQ